MLAYLLRGGGAVNEVIALLNKWDIQMRTVRERMYRAPTPRERERWHALWLLARGWSSAQVAEALDRDLHTIGLWVAALRQDGPDGMAFEQSGGCPPALTGKSRPI